MVFVFTHSTILGWHIAPCSRRCRISSGEAEQYPEVEAVWADATLAVLPRAGWGGLLEPWAPTHSLLVRGPSRYNACTGPVGGHPGLACRRCVAMGQAHSMAGMPPGGCSETPRHT